ncbi:hypothetical protein [Bradyrhizobium elkanii]|uniref:hypothetical protein n=1 Tax=Bradyrhizobium elkanii TaxID=29448 RepID=UPI000483D5B0|nr:hypothetical protein [Bradyrhizobium elkanii]WLA80984.1 hypothetical protein QNJ99_37320 [Bradyrhizobium elkanii]
METQIADAVLLHGRNKVCKDAAHRPVDNTCHRRTGRHEEDGAGQHLIRWCACLDQTSFVRIDGPVTDCIFRAEPTR